MERSYDLIIIGASFAGVACALEAARAGMEVCVVERKNDPGERLHTTGILVPEALAQPALANVPAHLLREVSQVRLYAPNLRCLTLSASGYRFRTTDTPALMRWWVQHLQESGIDLRLGTSFREAQEDAAGWYLPGVGHCRDLVGADGARSRVAERCGLSRNRQFLHGVEFEFDGASLSEPDALHCFISRRLASGYLGWVARTPTGVQAGLAHRAGARSPPLPDIRAFLSHVAPVLGPLPAKADSVRAGLIPCGGPLALLSRNRAHLLGDAAGVVSPVTAGGIHAALKHGAALARYLADPTRDPRGDARQTRRLAARAVPHFTGKRLLRWLFDHCQHDALFNIGLRSAPVRRLAEQLYFHRRGKSGGLRQPVTEASHAGSATIRD